MKMIRPVSDLRNHFADMVVLSMEAYENLQLESEIYTKLQAAEREEEMTAARCTSEEILAGAEAILKENHAV